MLAVALSSLAQSSSSPQTIPPSQASAQADGQTPEVPKFHSESRQVIVEAEVWNQVDKNSGGDGSFIPPVSTLGAPEYGAQGLKTIKDLRLPPPARGLTANDFRVLDNGVEQRINYFKEADFPAVGSLTTLWGLVATTRGTWGTPSLSAYYAHSASYLIGYVPRALRPGECHTIQVVVPNHYVQENRKQYCGSKDSDAQMTPEEVQLFARMRSFANSPARGKITVFAGAFAFWSTGVLSLIQEHPSGASSVELPATDFRYVVDVHDSKAPATVQIATQVLLPKQTWKRPCPKNAAIHILGTIFNSTNGEIAGQFGDTLRCHEGDDPISVRLAKVALPFHTIPSVWDTEIDLLPGRYKIRVLVTDGRDFGRAYADLQVRPLDSNSLNVSDLAVNSVLLDAALIVRLATAVTPNPLVPAPLVSKMVTLTPVPTAPPLVQDVQFLPFPYAQAWKGTPIPLYFEIYKPVPDTDDSEIYYRMRIADLKTGATVMETEPISAADFVVPGNGVVPIGLKLDTSTLQPSAYRLEVQASDSAGHESEWRSANFTIN